MPIIFLYFARSTKDRKRLRKWRCFGDGTAKCVFLPRIDSNSSCVDYLVSKIVLIEFVHAVTLSSGNAIVKFLVLIFQPRFRCISLWPVSTASFSLEIKSFFAVGYWESKGLPIVWIAKWIALFAWDALYIDNYYHEIVYVDFSMAFRIMKYFHNHRKCLWKGGVLCWWFDCWNRVLDWTNIFIVISFRIRK